MRHITTLLAASTLILAITSIYLYRQLSTARERARRDSTSEGDLHGKVARLEEIRDGLETDLRAARHAPSAQPPLTAAASITPRTTPGALPASLPRVPEMTEEQRLLFARRRYTRIFKELALSDAEVAAILPVLVQQDLRANKPLPKELANRPQSEPQHDQAELAGVLGAQKAERFAALRKQQPVRAEISVLRMRLDDSGEPLTTEQQQALFEILSNRNAEPVPRRIEGDDPQRSMDRMLTSMRERDQRLRQDVAPVLTPAQRRLLEEEATLQDAMRPRVTPIVPPQAGSSAP